MAESGQKCTDVSLVQRQKEPLEAPSSRPESPELGAGAGRHPRGGRAVKPAGTLPSPLSLGGRPEGETLGEDGLVSATGAALGCTGWLARSCLKTPFSFQTRVLTTAVHPPLVKRSSSATRGAAIGLMSRPPLRNYPLRGIFLVFLLSNKPVFLLKRALEWPLFNSSLGSILIRLQVVNIC